MSTSNSNVAAISEIYNARAPSYHSSHSSLHVRQTRSYLAHLTPYLHAGASLLDLACGTGLLSLPAKSLVGAAGRVVGVDVSPGMLAVARQKARDQGVVDVEWHEHDVTDLDPLVLGSFDVIACASALVLLPDPAAAVRGWTQRLLKPGGRLMTDVHVPSSNVVMDVFAAIGGSPEVGGERLKWGDMSLFRSQGDLCKVLEDAGLEIERAWEERCGGSGCGGGDGDDSETVIDVQDAEGVFDTAVQSLMFANFAKEGVRDGARVEFARRLGELGASSTDGKVREETRYWMCIGRKPG